ncbi:M20/M25/M40 family metallo-hydrolase [Chlamydia sp. 17-3921]|uniref:M20/M25/M40 family metallo-hydrolase n=1 Tax=Chlamydia sp. 17-3921 TaxID=2675798 RepID=UPI00191AA9F8|nr:M20/M25/M40 family metallo-hydrolase [Chlamydia sp. 17-3921]
MHQDFDYFDLHYKSFIKDFASFLSFPSLSSDPSHLNDCKKCAEFLITQLSDIFTIELWETEGHPPIIYASNKQAGPEKPSLLLYNHYDVQPAHISDGWCGDPFTLRQQGNYFYARGVSDNKGQCFYVLKALQYYYNTRGSFPINLIWLIEGEEESGSSSLFSLIEKKKSLLKADYLLIMDGGPSSAEYPSICVSGRGLVTLKVHLQEGTKDMHSGIFGGIAYNVNRALVEILSTLHKPDNSIAIEHFYDDIIPIEESEHPDSLVSNIIKECEGSLGFHPSGYESSYTPEEAAAYRPALDINGITGGYTGPGFKSVIPYQATAYISCRLIFGQQPEKIAQLIIDHLKKHTPATMKFSYEIHSGSEGWRIDPRLPIVHLLQKIYSELYQKNCLRLPMTATIPIGPTLGKISQAAPVICGTSYISDNIHAAEENFSLDQLRKGFISICRLLDELSNI